MNRTEIEWADVTWNPVTGCTHGCDYCWARRFAARLAKNPMVAHRDRYDGFKPTLWPERLGEPSRWRKPRTVFVCSMGDLFDPFVDRNMLRAVFETMVTHHRHRYILCTKNIADARRDLCAYAAGIALPWTLLVSVTNQADADARIPALLECPVRMRGVSIEPMLGPVDLSRWLSLTDGDGHCTCCGELRGEGHECAAGFARLDWVIVGGQTGPGAKPIHADWVRSVRDQCVAAGVPFFFKQMGGRRTADGRMLDGREWNEMPEVMA